MVPALALLVVTSCAQTSRHLRPWERIEHSGPAMGTTFRVVLYARDRAAGERAAREALDLVMELDRRLSDYDPESELSRFSRTSEGVAEGPWTSLSPDLLVLLEASARFSELSHGAFDITVGPLVRLWRRARRQGELPASEPLRAALARVNPASIELDPDGRRGRLLRADMRLDLGGIAKGYALDRALGLLRAKGYEHVLLDGGGDLLIGAAPPEGPGWRVLLAGFDGSERLDGLFRRAVATSGDLERYVELDGVRYSHLIDPRTGAALVERRLVTVLAPDGASADALASAVSVLGAEAGRALLESLADVEGRVLELTPDGPLDWRTTGFPETVSSPVPLTNPPRTPSLDP